MFTHISKIFRNFKQKKNNAIQLRFLKEEIDSLQLQKLSLKLTHRPISSSKKK